MHRDRQQCFCSVTLFLAQFQRFGQIGLLELAPVPDQLAPNQTYPAGICFCNDISLFPNLFSDFVSILGQLIRIRGQLVGIGPTDRNPVNSDQLAPNPVNLEPKVRYHCKSNKTFHPETNNVIYHCSATRLSIRFMIIIGKNLDAPSVVEEY